MKHRVEARYPAQPAVVIKMFTDRDFHTRKLDAIAANYKVLNHQFDGKTFSIRIERKVPIQMPGIGKTAAETTVVNEESWTLATQSGRITVQAGAMPLEVVCAAAITADGKGSLVTYQWDVKSRVPLIGGQIEKIAIADMDRRSTQETEAALALLPQYR